jgi:glycosyltransferase involved in cell wall biosynthesis
MAAEARGALPKRLVLWQNYRKVRSLERRIVRHVDMFTGITEEDAAALGATAPGKPRLTLTPGHSGWVASERTIDSATPRRVVIVGSFRWVIKQENLARFVEIADPVFRRNGIELDVVGDVPEELLATLRGRCTATHFHGFVDDIADVLGSARIAVVPELIGGGFKLKFLDYIFARVPIVTLSQAATGLAPQLQRAVICSSDLPSLADDIVRNIDDIAALNELQQRAFAAAEALFRWQDRGQQLLQAIVDLKHEREGAAGLPRSVPDALGVNYGSAR